MSTGQEQAPAPRPAARGRRGAARPRLPAQWVEVGTVTQACADGVLRFEMAPDDAPGAERGIASVARLADVTLAFELWLAPGACFIAKIRQQDRVDQTTNSYHLMCREPHAYLGMHNRVLASVAVRRGAWQRVVLRHAQARLEVEVDGRTVVSRYEHGLADGYCFLGVKGGSAEVRGLSIEGRDRAPAARDVAAPGPAFSVVRDFGETFCPRVSIVTTVYDRVACLEQCLESVARLRFRDFEHIVISDHPPGDTVERIAAAVARCGSARTRLLDLQRRHNDWGIAPAAAGLSVARGEYVCFLSDDNGYTSEHLDALVRLLDRQPEIGFAYCSCRYAGRAVLRSPVPRPGAIDLGQPLFRRALFDAHLGGGLPFDMMAWDWYMIKSFMDAGVRWRHVDRETFLFRLSECVRARRTGT